MVPRRVKERLKPWQVEGLKHLFETIILDHDSDLWRAHRREVAAARQALGTGASPEAEDAPCHAGGAILAQVRQPPCLAWVVAVRVGDHRCTSHHSRQRRGSHLAARADTRADTLPCARHCRASHHLMTCLGVCARAIMTGGCST